MATHVDVSDAVVGERLQCHARNCEHTRKIMNVPCTLPNNDNVIVITMNCHDAMTRQSVTTRQCNASYWGRGKGGEGDNAWLCNRARQSACLPLDASGRKGWA